MFILNMNRYIQHIKSNEFYNAFLYILKSKFWLGRTKHRIVWIWSITKYYLFFRILHTNAFQNVRCLTWIFSTHMKSYRGAISTPLTNSDICSKRKCHIVWFAYVAWFDAAWNKFPIHSRYRTSKSKVSSLIEE